MKRAALLPLFTLLASCSSWNTGTNGDRDAEQACLDTTEALARAGARCGEEYQRLYDQTLVDVAQGDCKNVTSIRDEGSLRATCLPSLMTEACTDVLAGTRDPSCSAQLQRSH